MLHENRKYCKGGGVAIFGHEFLCYTKRNDLCINCEAMGSFSTEIRNSDVKNIIFNIVYRPFFHIHVFFKKHKFKKHEAQNAEILRNILEKLPNFFTMQCFHREDCRRVLHKFPQGFFYIKTNRQNHTQRVDAISTGK